MRQLVPTSSDYNPEYGYRLPSLAIAHSSWPAAFNCLEREWRDRQTSNQNTCISNLTALSKNDCDFRRRSLRICSPPKSRLYRSARPQANNLLQTARVRRHLGPKTDRIPSRRTCVSGLAMIQTPRTRQTIAEVSFESVSPLSQSSLSHGTLPCFRRCNIELLALAALFRNEGPSFGSQQGLERYFGKTPANHERTRGWAAR